MPIYMDTHEDTTDLPAPLRQKVAERVRTGEKDSFGVVDKGIIIDREGRSLHCILDAPNVDAIMQHHKSLDVPLNESTIHRADVILR